MATNAWELFSNMDLAYDTIQKACSMYTEYPGPDTLKGPAINPSSKTRAPCSRARHTAAIGATTLKTIEPDTVFTLAAKSKNPIELQWALITLIAIDSEMRESLAVTCPPLAASLLRSLPERFERYLMGEPPSIMAMTPHEAVLDFTLRLQFAFTTISENHP